MKLVYFIYQDANAFERQSDGVQFCFTSGNNDKIYFYCDEYSVFWEEISDVGNFDKCCNIHPKLTIRPATLAEISKNNLINYINTVKEIEIENNNLKNVVYIHLTS